MARVGSLPGRSEGVPAKILPHMATLVIQCPPDTQTKPRLPRPAWRGPSGGGGGATNWLLRMHGISARAAASLKLGEAASCRVVGTNSLEWNIAKDCGIRPTDAL